jgi:hypothetical protein
MKFTLNLNLDDDSEREAFIKRFGTMRGRALAHRLNLKCKGSAKLASAISNYAWNRHVAYACRIDGRIPTAFEYELICDRIYRNSISPVCECW